MTSVNRHCVTLFRSVFRHCQRHLNNGTYWRTQSWREFHVATPVAAYDLRKVELTPLEQRKLTFDSHAMVIELESNGFEKRQAEIIVAALVTLATANMDIVYKDMVTGAHQEIALQQIMAHLDSIRKDMVILEKSEFANLRSENAKMKTELDQIRNRLMARERLRSKVMRPPKHSPTKPHCLTQRASNPEASRTNVSEETPCTWRPWLVCTAPGPPQESLVRDETRISLPAKPSLIRTTQGQMWVAPRTSRSRPAATEPERQPRVSGGTCVCPVLDYSAGVWGAKRYFRKEHVHNRAVRYFLGVHKFAPILAITGDMGWDPCAVRWKACVVRLWDRLLDMPNARRASKVFQWDLSIGGTWTTEMFDLFQQSDCEHLYKKNKFRETWI
ncbi:coiled-coil domain-containing protein 90B, mitochondrial isoform X1 [Oncorhynchus masou masou]|uniref:coiled-coil domain-containing protein 90B, mitochondrial isoform X1 n=1 Tax=Oncorhynchus masou masou TaxID=90313 RepID=UPI003182E6A5